MPTLFFAFRNVAFVTCCFSSLGAIVICGHWESLRWKASRGSPESLPPIRDFEISTFVFGALTEIILAWLLLAGVKSRLALFARVGVELSIIAFVWLMWMVNCILIFPKRTLYSGGCDSMEALGRSRCYEYVILGLFSLFNWSFLFLYFTTTFVSAWIGHSRNNLVWSRSVKEATFFSHLPKAPKSVPAGTMKIDPSPVPSVMGKMSLRSLRREFEKHGGKHHVGAVGPSPITPSHSASSSLTVPDLSGAHSPDPEMRIRNSLLLSSQTPDIEEVDRPLRPVSLTMTVPVVLEPEAALQSTGSRYEWYPGMPPPDPSSRHPYLNRRLSTIEERLEKKDTLKAFKRSSSSGRPSSSGSKSGKRPSSSSSAKSGKRPSSSSSTVGKYGGGGLRPSSSSSTTGKRPGSSSSTLVTGSGVGLLKKKRDSNEDHDEGDSFIDF